VEQAPDKSKSPPSTSYRETYRRHRKLFFIPVILGALAAGFMAFTSGGSFQSTASLWIDTAPPLASSVGASLSPPLTEPPAAAEQGILNELLTTQAFATSVAKSSLLGKALGSEASIQSNAPAYVENKQVGSLVTGAQVLKITYKGSSPAMTQSVLGGIVQQLRYYNDGLSARHDEASVSYDREQVNAAETALRTARSNVNAYMAQHPNAGQSDPNLQSFTTAETNASTQLGQANTALAQATSPASSVPWTIQVVDQPGPAISAALGKKKLLELILAGAFAGLLVSILAVVALTPAKKEMWEDELPIGRPFVPDVPPADPLPFPMQSSPEPTGFGQERPRLATGGRQFVFRGSSDQIEDQ
jgi:uncharacterized protein involved in exopolysaccharide biosynthesis